MKVFKLCMLSVLCIGSLGVGSQGLFAEKKHDSSSSSSDSDLSVHKLNVNDDAHIKKAKIDTLEVEHLINAECVSIFQCQLPVTINEPGTYCFGEDLFWNRPGSAITVLANNVTILGNQHNLLISDVNGSGINVTSSYNFDVSGVNVFYQNVSGFSRGSALFLTSHSRANVTNLYVRGMNKGITLNSAQHVNIVGLDYSTPIPFPNSLTSFNYVGVYFAQNGSSDITIENSFVTDSPGVLSGDVNAVQGFTGVNRGLFIHDCEFQGLSWQGMRLEHWEGVVIQRCYFDYDFQIKDFFGGSAFTGLIRVGPLSHCTDVTVEDCQAFGKSVGTADQGEFGVPVFVAMADVSNGAVKECSYREQGNPCSAYRFQSGNGQVIENVLVEDSTCTDCDFCVLALSADTPIRGLVVRNNHCTGKNGEQGIRLVNVDGALVEANEVSTTNEVNEDSLIEFAAISMFGCTRNTVRNNAIGPWLQGPGIFMDSDSTQNLILNNSLNVTARIVDQGTDNESIGNIIVNSFNLPLIFAEPKKLVGEDVPTINGKPVDPKI